MHDWVSNNKNPWKDKRVWSPFVTMAACYPGMQAWHSLPAAEAGGHSQQWVLQTQGCCAGDHVRLEDASA